MGVRPGAADGAGICGVRVSLYTILPLPISYGMYCNTGWSGGNTILRNSVGDAGRVGAQTRELFATNSIVCD